jgi:hypothetical protein
MDWPHAGCPHGVPTYYSWQSVPEVDDATDASAQPLTIPWGQIYADCTATEPTNVRIELRNIEEWLWSKSQSKWVEVATSPTVNGGHFSECFCGSDGPQPNWRQESDGGISSTMVAGYNLHFWTTAGRVPIQLPASGIGAVYSTFEARLILDDPTGPNNLAQAKYLANAGADWWSANGAQNPSPGMGRFTYLTTSWQAEDFYTGSGPDNTYGPSAYPPGWTNLQLEAFAPPITG